MCKRVFPPIDNFFVLAFSVADFGVGFGWEAGRKLKVAHNQQTGSRTRQCKMAACFLPAE